MTSVVQIPKTFSASSRKKRIMAITTALLGFSFASVTPQHLNQNSSSLNLFSTLSAAPAYNNLLNTPFAKLSNEKIAYAIAEALSIQRYRLVKKPLIVTKALSGKIDCAINAISKPPLNLLNIFTSFDFIGSLGLITRQAIENECQAPGMFDMNRIPNSYTAARFSKEIVENTTYKEYLKANAQIGLWVGTFKENPKFIFVGQYFPQKPHVI